MSPTVNFKQASKAVLQQCIGHNLYGSIKISYKCNKQSYQRLYLKEHFPLHLLPHPHLLE